MSRTETLRDFINTISSEAIFLKDDPSEIRAYSLELLYKISEERIDYSVITRYILNFENDGFNNDEQIDILELNIDYLVDFLNNASNENQEPHIKNLLYKIKDHISLALIQKKFTEDYPKRVIKDELSMFLVMQEKLESEYKHLQEVLERSYEDNEKLREELVAVTQDVNNTKTSIYTSIITILGIFTAIVFGVFGSIEILGNVMSNISEVKISKLLIFSSLIIAAILTLLYLLLNGLANLTDLTIRSCGCINTASCNHPMYQKHPVYISSMLVSMYLFTVGVIAHGFNTSNFNGIFLIDNFMSNGFSLVIISLVGLLILTLIFIKISKYSFIKNKN